MSRRFSCGCKKSLRFLGSVTGVTDKKWQAKTKEMLDLEVPLLMISNHPGEKYTSSTADLYFGRNGCSRLPRSTSSYCSRSRTPINDKETPCGWLTDEAPSKMKTVIGLNPIARIIKSPNPLFWRAKKFFQYFAGFSESRLALSVLETFGVRRLYGT